LEIICAGLSPNLKKILEVCGLSSFDAIKYFESYGEFIKTCERRIRNLREEELARLGNDLQGDFKSFKT
jgi:hypothetical protein